MQDVPSGPMKVKAASLAGVCRSFTLPKTKAPPPFFAWKRSFLLHCLSQPFACVLLCFVQRSSKVFLQNVRLYFTGYNLFCWTGYSGADPEVDTSSRKNPLNPGIDYAAYPKSRSYVGGINISF